MSLNIKLIDSTGSKNGAKVTNRGQLVVSPLDYSTSYQQNLVLVDTAYNYISPLPGKRFVITDIILSANKDVSATVESTITIYESTSSTSTTASRTIYETGLIKLTQQTLVGLNLITTEGTFINGKCTDNSIFSTIMGYYIDA